MGLTALANSPETYRISESFELSWSVVLAAVLEVLAGDCALLCGSFEDDAPLGKSRMSPSGGKLATGFTGGRRLLTRGTSASANSRKAIEKASQLGIIAADFAGQRAVSACVFDDAINGLRRDGGQVALSKGPFFAH